MKTLKLLLAAVLCVGGMQGALIVSGTISESQSVSTTNFGSSATLLLSDGVKIVDLSYSSDGGQSRTCSDSGSGCYITGFSVAPIGQGYGYSALLSVSYSGSVLALHGVETQTLQSYFTISGDLSYQTAFYVPNSCPFPEVSPMASCRIPLTGSGIATVTVKQYLSGGLPAGFYVSDTTLNFTTPEPATPILLTAGLGLLFFIRKRRAA